MTVHVIVIVNMTYTSRDHDDQNDDTRDLFDQNQVRVSASQLCHIHMMTRKVVKTHTKTENEGSETLK